MIKLLALLNKRRNFYTAGNKTSSETYLQTRSFKMSPLEMSESGGRISPLIKPQKKKKVSGLKRLQFPFRCTRWSFYKLSASKGLLKIRANAIRSDGKHEEQQSQVQRIWCSDLVVDDSDDERAARTCGHLLAVFKIILQENTPTHIIFHLNTTGKCKF